MDQVVGIAELRRFATEVLGGDGVGGGDGVIDYLQGRHSLLRDIAIESEQGALQGGWGKTGGFHQGLLRFSAVFGIKMMEFVNEEGEFIQFLGELRERMLAAAAAYEEAESQNIQGFSSIANKLDGQ